MRKYSENYNLRAATKFSSDVENLPNLKGMDIEAIFGENTFGMEEMRSRLPKSVFKKMLATLERGVSIEMETADAIAMAMKEWAVERGAMHFSHWFQPLTGFTAEKHDSFITPNRGGGAMAQFSGKELIQGEPDGSSFPNGGLRNTAEARGYTAWDPTSPAFIMETPGGSYLSIPTAFAAWSGEALDHKLPLLRSIKNLDIQARRVLELFGVSGVQKVSSTVGNEQEYFLIDEEYFYRRPDLINCGRTLFGAKPSRGQELDDHYFGSIPERILACMIETEEALYRLGVPVKTRHNEVAPGQYEIAPIFETANIAADHQQVTMIMLQNIARRHGLVCLLHEKPFAGINGSGKHNNWSMSTDAGMNLLDPSDTPHSNEQFLFICGAIIRAVYRHQDLLRISVASAGNDHRLGANEAPPAIISIFLGDQLEEIFAELKSGPATKSKQGGYLHLGVDAFPKLPRHSGDRNRTSPFAFTGNKFEFRALGSAQSSSFANTVLNVIVAESLGEMATMLEAKTAAGMNFNDSVTAVLNEVITEASPIIFGGDNYADAWQEEAERRGLLNLKTTLDALNTMCSKKNIDLFSSCNVLSEAELRSRHEVWVEQYFLKINIEAETTESIAQTMIMPAAIQHLNMLTETAQFSAKLDLDYSGVRSQAKKVSKLINKLHKRIQKLHNQNKALGGDSSQSKAEHMKDHVIPAMNKVRVVADKLEKTISHDLWPMPTYREILFVK